MTTIAFDGHTLASDTAMAYETILLQFNGKIRRFASGCLAGFAGEVTSGIKLLDWLESDDETDLELPEDDDTDAILITPDGEITLYDRTGVPMPIEGKLITLGTGGDIALGAMLAGADAKKAVEIAISRDKRSGFQVIFFQL